MVKNSKFALKKASISLDQVWFNNSIEIGPCINTDSKWKDCDLSKSLG